MEQYIKRTDYVDRYYKDALMSELHREDGPAIESTNGYKEWYLNGKLHREDGPALEYANGDKMWFINGKLHREDGPAIEYADGDKAWFINDKLHRLDGPATERVNGDKEWYAYGKKYTPPPEKPPVPAIERSGGDKARYISDMLHRLGKTDAKPATHRYLTEGYRPTARGLPTPKKVPKLVSGVTTASLSPEYKSARELKIDANGSFFNLQNLSIEELRALRLDKQLELESIDREIKRHVKINELRYKINLHQDEVNYYSKELDRLL